MRDGATIDEFTSTVNREAARAACTSLSRYLRTSKLKKARRVGCFCNSSVMRVLQVVLATCHTDVEAWLRPDWTFDTGSSELRYLGACLSLMFAKPPFCYVPLSALRSPAYSPFRGRACIGRAHPCLGKSRPASYNMIYNYMIRYLM